MKCAKMCKEYDVTCPNSDCRSWIDYEEDLNCTHIAVEKHGCMTLRQIGVREGVTHVAVKYIVDSAGTKLRKKLRAYQG